MAYDRTKPFNDLPLLPPQNIGDDVDILKKLVTASRALAGVELQLKSPHFLVAIPKRSYSTYDRLVKFYKAPVIVALNY